MIGKLTRKQQAAPKPQFTRQVWAGYLLLIMLLLNNNLGAQTLLTENFSTSSGTTPPTGWVQNYIVGSSNNKWFFNNPNFRTISSPMSAPAAIFDSDYLGSGAGSHTVALESPQINTSGKTTVRLKFDHYFHRIYNSSDSVAVEVYDGSIWNIVWYSQSSTAISGNVDLDISAYAANITNAKVRFKFRGNWSWYWIVDNVEVYAVPACSGTPNPGNTIASANPACLSTSPTLSLQNTTAGSGVTYQWQSSPNGTTWTNIAGATSSTYNPIANGYYRCNVTCSGNTGTSSSLLFTLTNFMSCYCIPPIGGSSSSDGCQDTDEILNVTMGTLNNSTSCASNSSTYAYRDFGGTVAAPTFNLGSNYTISVTTPGNYPDHIAAWIDFNHNGSFDASEFFAIGIASSSSPSVSNSWSIPTSALTGTTKMRVKLMYSTSSTMAIANTSACAGYTWGECQDYNVEIVCAANISAHPSDAAICAGANTSFGITASNANSYKWQVSTNGGTTWSDISNGGVYSNATTNTLTITGATASMHGYKYRGLANNTAGACSATSNIATFTVNGIVSATQGFACAGSATSVSVTPGGGTVNWYDQATGGTLLGTGNTLNIPSAPGSNTTYYAQAASCTPRTAVLLTVNSAASVSANPVNSTICEHTNTSFSVTATNVASYKWQVSTNGGVSFTNIINNAVYSGATTATLSITGATTAMHGNQYRCELTTSCAVVSNSNAAILGVNAAPAVVTHPIDKTLCDGASFTLSAAGSGFGTLSFQWQLSTNGGTTWSNLSNGGIYSGVATNILSVSSTTTAMNGYRYRAVITGTCAPAANTNSALLTVNALPAVTGNPSSITICPGTNTTFTCSGTGAAITYQWQVSTNGGTSFTNVTNGGVYSNATTATLNITGATAGMTAYQYRCRISGTCTPNALTTAATLTVAGAPVITSQPVDAIICTANSDNVSVGATGFNLTYQWEVSTNSGTTWSNVTNGGVYSGAATNSLMITTPVLAMNGHQYRCKVTNGCAVTTTSNAMTLTVGNSPTVNTQPTNKTVCQGDNTSYTVAASSSSPISYQWQGSVDGVSWSNLVNAGKYSGVTTSTLSITNATIGMFTMFRCAMSTGCIPPATTNVVTLTIETAPIISINPTNQVKCAGENASFGISATGSNLSYQWQVSTNGGSTWSNLSNGGGYSGVTTNSLAVNNTQASQNGYRYRCVATGSCPTAKTSGTATLTVNTPVSITSHPTTAQTLCSGANTSLTASATGTGLSYRWYRNVNGTWTALNNGGIYSGVTTTTLNITNITASGNTQVYIYQCRVTGTCNSISTNAATITVHAKPTITSNPPNVTKCDSTNNASFKVIATGTNISYQWQMNTGSGWNNMVNNSTYSGVTTAILLIPDVYYSMNGYQFRCVVSGTCTPAVTSGVGTLTVTPLVTPSVTIGASNEDICAGTNVTFTASPVNGGTNPTYVWKRSGSSVGTGSSYSSTTLTNNATVWVEMTSKAACPSPTVVSSNIIQMTVTQYSTPTIAITSDVGNTWCSGKPATFRATTTNEGPNPTYEWTVNNQPVGANVDTYLTSLLVDGDKVQCKVTSSIMCPSPKSVSSNIITMTIHPTTRSSIVIAANPDTVVCAKKEVTMYTFFTNGGAAPAFQWMLNGKDIAGEIGGTLKINSLNNGDTINCRFSSSATCVFPEISNPVVFNIIPLIDPAVTISMYYIGNETYRFVAIPTNGGSNPSYQWYNNNVAIAGANAETYDAVGLTKGNKIHVEMVSSELCVNPDYQVVSSRNIGTGIGELGNNFSELGLYPNPNSGQFNIKGNLDQPVTDKEIAVKITNSLGQTVFTKVYTAGGTEVNLPVTLDRDLANGMYQVNVSIDGNISNLRFVLNR